MKLLEQSYSFKLAHCNARYQKSWDWNVFSVHACVWERKEEHENALESLTESGDEWYLVERQFENLLCKMLIETRSQMMWCPPTGKAHTHIYI